MLKKIYYIVDDDYQRARELRSLLQPHLPEVTFELTDRAEQAPEGELVFAADTLASEGISTEIVDLRSLRPIDDKTIMQSVKKTGHLIAVDTGWSSCGISAEILALVAEIGFGFLKSAPIRIAMPDEPVATSWQLARHQYPRHTNIIAAVFDVLGREFDRESLLAISNDEKLDTPDLTFTGPF